MVQCTTGFQVVGIQCTTGFHLGVVRIIYKLCTALLVLVNTGSGCLVNTLVVMPLIMAPPV